MGPYSDATVYRSISIRKLDHNPAKEFLGRLNLLKSAAPRQVLCVQEDQGISAVRHQIFPVGDDPSFWDSLQERGEGLFGAFDPERLSVDA